MLKKSASWLIALTIACGAFAGHAAASPDAGAPATKLEASVEKLLGIRYKYGGDTVRGFDCSGFTRYIFAQFGIDLPRTSAGQAGVGAKVSKNELRPGDLVFFNTNGKGISHVGIYMGDGKFAHASTTRGITITPMNDKYYSKRYVTARRVLDEKTYLAFAAENAAPAAADGAASNAAETVVIAAIETAISDAAAVAVSDDAFFGVYEEEDPAEIDDLDDESYGEEWEDLDELYDTSMQP